MQQNRNSGAEAPHSLMQRLIAEYESSYSVDIYPIQMEPLLGSNERWTVALVAIGIDGTFKVINTIPKIPATRALGRFGESLFLAASQISDDLKVWLDSQPIDTWSPLFSSVEIGQKISARCDDIDQGVEAGITTFASFMAKSLNENSTEDDADQSTKEKSGSSAWESRIKKSVIQKRGYFGSYFGRSIKLKHKGTNLPYKFGFLGGKLAADFAWVTPRQLDYHLKNAESKLMHLEQLRSHQSTANELLSLNRFELLVYTPSPGDPNYSDTELARSLEAYSGLLAFGDEHEISVLQMQSHEAAANRIIKLESS